VHADAVAFCNVSELDPKPTGHRSWSSHAERSSPRLNGLSASVQSSHVTSAVALPAVSKPLPAAQVAHTVHEASLPALILKVSGGHGVHVAGMVLSGDAVKNSPAGQSVSFAKQPVKEFSAGVYLVSSPHGVHVASAVLSGDAVKN
jgi:hypothetical protein